MGDFGNLRHAHSQLGYYGVLFPLAWAAWSRIEAPVPSTRVLIAYGVATAVATFGFIRAGYGPEAIAGSTLIGTIWLISAWPLRSRLRDLHDPLAVVPFGVVGALACIPPIAVFLRRDPDLAHGFVATFLSGLLLGVIVPSVCATISSRRAPWPVVLLAAGAGAAALGVTDAPLARAGLLLYGTLLGGFAWSADLPVHGKVMWAAVACGLGALALGVLPNARPVAIGAIHFLILGPILEPLLPESLRTAAPTPAWWVHHAGVTLLSGPLVLQGIGAGNWTLTASAIGGSVVTVWWLCAGVVMQRVHSEAPS